MVELNNFLKDKFPEINQFIDCQEGFYEGKKIDTLFSGGVKAEGNKFDGQFYSSAEEAWEAYYKSLHEYLSQKIDLNKKYTLVWRLKPEIDTFSEEEETLYMVRSRLLLIENLD